MDPHLRFYLLSSHLSAILFEVCVVSRVYRMVGDNGWGSMDAAMGKPSLVLSGGLPVWLLQDHL